MWYRNVAIAATITHLGRESENGLMLDLDSTPYYFSVVYAKITIRCNSGSFQIQGKYRRNSIRSLP